MHWGTFDLALHAWDEPAETLLAEAQTSGARVLTPLLGRPFEPADVERPNPWWREVRPQVKLAATVAAPPTRHPISDRRPKEPAHMSFHDFSATTIDGRTQALASYKGKVVLVVNTASACGFTPQYTGLEKLWRDYQDRGVVVLGFPSNDFGAQEPGSEAEIQAFCSRNYGVSFPLFSKIKTTGKGQDPLYAFLAAKTGAPQWNFHKYLVGKDGQVLAAFPSSVAPDDAKLRAAIDAALA